MLGVVFLPTFLLLLWWGAAARLVAGLLSHRDGGDDAGLAAQTSLLLFLLQVPQDVLRPLVGSGHGPRREGLLQGVRGQRSGFRGSEEHTDTQGPEGSPHSTGPPGTLCGVVTFLNFLCLVEVVEVNIW